MWDHKLYIFLDNILTPLQIPAETALELIKISR
jgi:hypothetical protein